MAQWSNGPQLTSEQLRTALADLRSDRELYALPSDALKADYLKTSRDLTARDWIDDFPDHFPIRNSALSAVKRMEFWALGEPELTQRLLRHALANQLLEIDKPAAAGRASTNSSLLLFEVDPSAQPVGHLDARSILKASKRPFGGGNITFVPSQFAKSVSSQAGRQATIEALLAIQAYRRDHGEFPDELSRLVPDYLLSIPHDPCDLAGSSLRYQSLADRAIVWSIGPDGHDDDGDIENRDVGFAALRNRAAD